jgi:glutaredoxin
MHGIIGDTLGRRSGTMGVEHVAGKKAGNAMLYALSTCPWCRRTKALLGELGVAYDFTDVDLLEGAEKEATLDEVKRHNPGCSFPTLVMSKRNFV